MYPDTTPEWSFNKILNRFCYNMMTFSGLATMIILIDSFDGSA